MREVQTSAIRLLRSYGIPVDVVEEYDCVPVRVRQVGESIKLQTMLGSRAVKFMTQGMEQIQRAFMVSEYVATRLPSPSPRFIRNRYGDAYVRDGDRFLYMTDWVVGRDINPEDPEEIVGAMAALARWHLAAQGALREASVYQEKIIEGSVGHNVDSTLTLGQQLKMLAESAQKFWERIRIDRQRTEFERLFAGFARPLLQETEEVLKKLTSSSWVELEQAALREEWVCHGRFHHRQLRFDGNGYTVVDFRYVHPGLPLQDVLVFLDRYLAEQGWNRLLAETAISSYIEAIQKPDWLDPLGEALAAPWAILGLVHRHQEGSDAEQDVDLLEMLLAQHRPKRQTLEEMWQRHQVEYSETPASVSLANDEIRIRPYRPSVRRGKHPPSQETGNDPVRLWGDAHHPEN